MNRTFEMLDQIWRDPAAERRLAEERLAAGSGPVVSAHADEGRALLESTTWPLPADCQVTSSYVRLGAHSGEHDLAGLLQGATWASVGCLSRHAEWSGSVHLHRRAGEAADLAGDEPMAVLSVDFNRAIFVKVDEVSLRLRRDTASTGDLVVHVARVVETAR